jgi:hypothetical protein
VLLAACTGELGGQNHGASGSGNASSSAGNAGSSASSGSSGTAGVAGMQEPPLGITPDAIAQACAENNGVLNVGLTKLRRLTRDQLNNTLRDLLGVTGNKTADIAPDEHIGPFHSNAIAPITDLLVQQHQELAARLASEVRPRMSELVPCDLGSGTDCVIQFVEHFGLRTYRRPLAAAEVQKYVALYGVGAQGGGAQNGFRLVVEAMLQSPFFLYHADVGAAGVPSAAPVALDAFELASRLAYFLWNSMPDDELFGLAQTGSLLQDATLGPQVERMLQDSRAAATIALFHRQWLGLEDLPNREKDPARFPLFNLELADAMLAENAAFTDYVVRQGDGLLGTLLTADFSFPQGSLFQVYGVAEPPGFTPGTRVSLDGTQRAGILTQAAFLARHAHRDQTSPVHRGILVRENLMCQLLEPPPENVANAPPPASPATSTRERFAQHSLDPTCAQCHQVMDPIGLGFEHYDAIGAWRTTDGLGAVDARGEVLAAGDDLKGSFDGAIELAERLSGAREVKACFSNQWFRFALGRVESRNDACSIQAIHEGFIASQGNIRALFGQIAQSEAFRHVRSTAGQETSP